MKIFRFTEIRKARMYRLDPARGRGAYRDRHDTRAGRRWTQVSSARRRSRRAGNRERGAPRKTSDEMCVRRNRVVPAPERLAPSWCGDALRPTGRAHRTRPQQRRGQQCIAPREERDIGRSNHRAGKAGMSRLPPYAAVHPFLPCHPHGGPRVPAGSRPSLRPLSIEGEAERATQSSGETRRESAKPCLATTATPSSSGLTGDPVFQKQ